MVKKRKLTPDERKMTKQGILLVQENIDDATYMEQYYGLMINKGIQINLKRQLRDYKKKRKEEQDTVDTNTKMKKIMNEHLSKGVEIKSKLKEEDK